MKNLRIECPRIEFVDTVWERLPCVSLVDVVTGGPVAEETKVKVGWDSEAFYVRFECRDDYAVSKYVHHDDPLYEQDVVEVFIDETGNGSRYMELELSPNNVVFDAMVDNDGTSYKGNIEWDCVGMETRVRSSEAYRTYDLKIPLVHFQIKPGKSTEWRINFYRIDEDRNGKRHFQAWSPTMKEDFHVPHRFGTLVFSE